MSNIGAEYTSTKMADTRVLFGFMYGREVVAYRLVTGCFPLDFSYTAGVNTQTSWGLRGGLAEDSILLGCDAVSG
jgi:hypothetical protein